MKKKNFIIGIVVLALLFTSGSFAFNTIFSKLKTEYNSAIDVPGLSLGVSAAEDPEDKSGVHTIRKDALTPGMVGRNESPDGNSAEVWRVGFSTKDLKANTRYRVTWSIDATVFTAMNVEIPVVNDNGKNQYSIYLNTSYHAGENLGIRWYSMQKNRILNNTIEFTTENAGDMVLFSLFEINVHDYQDAVAIGTRALEYVVFCTFQEVG